MISTILNQPFFGLNILLSILIAMNYVMISLMANRKINKKLVLEAIVIFVIFAVWIIPYEISRIPSGDGSIRTRACLQHPYSPDCMPNEIPPRE